MKILSMSYTESQWKISFQKEPYTMSEVKRILKEKEQITATSTTMHDLGIKIIISRKKLLISKRRILYWIREALIRRSKS